MSGIKSNQHYLNLVGKTNVYDIAHTLRTNARRILSIRTLLKIPELCLGEAINLLGAVDNLIQVGKEGLRISGKQLADVIIKNVGPTKAQSALMRYFNHKYHENELIAKREFSDVVNIVGASGTKYTVNSKKIGGIHAITNFDSIYIKDANTKKLPVPDSDLDCLAIVADGVTSTGIDKEKLTGRFVSQVFSQVFPQVLEKVAKKDINALIKSIKEDKKLSDIREEGSGLSVEKLIRKYEGMSKFI